jgi:hypothetical protein
MSFRGGAARMSAGASTGSVVDSAAVTMERYPYQVARQGDLAPSATA